MLHPIHRILLAKPPKTAIVAPRRVGIQRAVVFLRYSRSKELIYLNVPNSRRDRELPLQAGNDGIASLVHKAKVPNISFLVTLQHRNYELVPEKGPHCDSKNSANSRAAFSLSSLWRTCKREIFSWSLSFSLTSIAFWSTAFWI